ncbi:MAG: RNA-binding protein [Planctomycetaceae bacterium]|nr:RNA-binding protein [Planctomycetaceae bacterium]MCP4464513.1 RNA-binding protein [Planctomycetaceae bacterium]
MKISKSSVSGLLIVLLAVVAVVVFSAYRHFAFRAKSLPPEVKHISLVGEPEISAKEFLKQGTNAGKFISLPPEQTGLDSLHVWDPPERHRSLVTGTFGSGVAIGDIDQDGWQDVFVARQTDTGRLFRNLGGMQFEDVTEAWGIESDGMWATGTTFVDINNDGRLDLYLCGFDCPNRLYINRGDHFTEEAAEFGLDFEGASVVMTFADYDRDGDLDGYLVTNFRSPKDTRPAQVIREPGKPPRIADEDREKMFLVTKPDGSTIRSRAGQFDHLYRNDGGRFVEVTESSGIGWQPYIGLSATWWDYNSDGWPDLYVSNDYKGPDFLYRNNGVNDEGEVTFTDVISDAIPHTPWYSMGSDFADINNDGRLDYIASDMAGTTHYRDKLSMGNMGGPDSDAWFLNVPDPPQYMRNAVYCNTGTERFMEVAFLTGLAKTDWTWALKFADFDNDGWQDLFCTNGMTRDFFNSDLRDQIDKQIKEKRSSLTAKQVADLNFDFWTAQEPYRLNNLAFQNQGELKFKELGQKWGLDHLGVSTGAGVGDLDNDGDLDLVITGFEEPVRLYRNELESGNAIRFELLSERGNRNSLGARIELRDAQGNLMQVRYSSNARGFMSTHEPILHFGVGDLESVSEARVIWPSGNVQEFRDLKVNQTYTIIETEDAERPPAIASDTMFAPSESLAKFQHREFSFDDFAQQPLLPNQYSQLGPGMAWGDFDGDGDFDFYLGGAAFSKGRLVENLGDGVFETVKSTALEDHSTREDMGSVFFDADGDQDLDLYIVSGGVEAEIGSDTLQDRLYLNDGKGEYTESATLPDTRFSGSCVNVCDFDRDGKLDLFVGGRIVPGSWPESPRSALLRNTGQGFEDVTSKVAPDLNECGMVTGAIWSDIDGDDWIDLLVTLEWGPVKLFRNIEGQLVEQTQAAGLSERQGWHNSICGGDIDNDGDTDFVIGNWGLNSKYKATSESPAALFYGDFEGNGKKRIVEAKFEDGVCLPRRGLSCSSSAMPMVREKLPTFHEFATSDLFDIYTDERIEDSTRFEANHLESGVLINETVDGKVAFRFVPLPRLAQISAIFGCQLVDVDSDGFLDLYAVQNFYGPQRESGYLDGGVSLLLLGTGTGEFRAVTPAESGLVVPGDATSLVATDLNGDAQVDFVIGKNNGVLQAYVNQNTVPGTPLRIADYADGRLAIGAKVFLKLPNGQQRLHEVFAGQSYLSQMPQVIYGGGQIQKIEWPKIANENE